MTGRRLAHGYSNQSWLEHGQVVKEYDAVDGEERLRVEVSALNRVAGQLPVPRVISVDVLHRRAVMTLMPGRHGQELIEEGFASQVLDATGRALAQIQATTGGLVHGDYGPQNLLLEVGEWAVSAVLDWEFAHEGEPIEDLAWAEWIVRMHHPNAVESLPALFTGYGSCPSWALRQDLMLRKCSALLALCRHRGQLGGAREWKRRLQSTKSWTE